MKQINNEELLFSAIEEQRQIFVKQLLVQLKIEEISEEKWQLILDLCKNYEAFYFQYQGAYESEKRFNDWYFKPI